MAADLLEPHKVEIETLAGSKREYILSKFPAVQGREIIANYPLTALPKAGDYKANEAVMLKLMAFVAVDIKGILLPLTTQDLINNHVPDYETLVRIEIEMMKYNTSFFSGRGSLDFLKRYRQESPSVSYPNADYFIAAIVGANKATLKELQTIYTLEEALYIFEILAVQRFNEYLAVEYQKKKAGHK